jgi:type IX secretion system PorP/SprF family membrane protein
MKTIKLKIIGLLSLVSLLTEAQDLHFSQYIEVPTFLNPALAGVSYNTRAVVNYKTQWTSVGSKFLSYGFSFDQTIQYKQLKGSYFAISASIFKDALGDAKMHNLNPNLGFTYIQRVNKHTKISGGVQAGLNYRTIDINDLRFDSQFDGYKYDPNLSNGEPNLPRSSILAFDLGGGVNLNYVKADKYLSAKSNMKVNAGFSVFHFGGGRSSFISTSEKLLTKYCACNSKFDQCYCSYINCGTSRPKYGNTKWRHD